MKSCALLMLTFLAACPDRMASPIAPLKTRSPGKGSPEGLTVEGVEMLIHNPLDKRTLTIQGRRLLAQQIKQGRYALETVGADVAEWMPYIKKKPYVEATFGGKRYLVTSHSQPGKAFVTHSHQPDRPPRTDRITFGGFDLMKFMHLNPKRTIEVSDKLRVSFMLKATGENTSYQIFINGERVATGGGVGDSFSAGVPVNAFLRLGDNRLRVVTGPAAAGRISVSIDDWNKQYGGRIRGEQRGNEDKNGTFTIQGKVEFEEQTSILDP